MNGNLEELLRQPEIHNEDPLTARIEAAVQRARPAVQVPTTPVFYLCGRHFQEFQDRRVERVNARRAAATEPSWPLWEMNREGATVEIEPPYVFITESPENGGRRLRYDFARYADVKAWLEGKRVVYEVLTSKQIGDLKYRLSRAPQAPDPTEPGRYWAEQAQRLF